MTESKKNRGMEGHKPSPLTDNAGEVRELSSADMATFRPLSEVHPKIVRSAERSRGQRGEQKAPTKIPVSLRLSPTVVDYFRATGKGWHGRIDEILRREVAKKHG